MAPEQDNTPTHQQQPQEQVKKTNKIIEHEERFVSVTELPILKSERCSDVSCHRDIVLARVVQDKKFAMIKAWEDNEKTKADSRASNKFYAIESWEKSKIALFEAKLKKKEVELEKIKAKYAEKMKNRKAEIHKEAEEKRAAVDARLGQQMLKVEEEAAKYRATGTTPSKFLRCFTNK